ncbi:MAG TPA: FlgD immunoglobulin-like domain containing protein [Bacteroidota bacterium]|nr:FlgD immunoglobulin-like domain containing protein [Bacteroidota bacterium]
MKKLCVLFLIFAAAAFGQKRVLVSPYGDAIPIGKNQGAAEILKRSMTGTNAASPMVCTDKATFGFSADLYPNPNTNHIGFHQDIMAMWYVAPASGTIDSVFWWAAGVGSLDSTVTLRLFQSNIYPGNGPGNDGYPVPGRLCWGYFVNTNDLDNGVAAFPEDATDPTWFSTVSGAIPSFTPMGDEIWGFGGAPVVEQANAVNFYNLGVLGEPEINVGDPFFITIRIYGPHVPQAEEIATGFLSMGETDPMATHNWKFYEHIVEIQPGFTCPGWVARGDFNILFWYSMTVTTNIPPTFSDVTDVNNTLSTGPQVVSATIIDCNPEDEAFAGVEYASIRYALNDVVQPDIPMTYLGTDIWEAPIPGGSVNDVISYKIVAADSNGFTDSTGANEYKIVSLSTAWYSADTGAACAVKDISSTGTPVDTATFFTPPYSGSGTAPKDDGTSGPYDMGANFTVFSDTFRYAWIGVNGAIALSKSPLDTLDVNSNGFATTGWDFPFAQKSGRSDTAGAGNMPGMFIAPFWADFIIGDTAGMYGKILHGDNADPCLFIVQWDSIGAFDDLGSIPDITTFRVVLNRCDGTVEYQYESVGTTGLDSLALVGMQADSNEISGPGPGWIYVNRNTYPYETKPRDNWCVRLSPNIGTVALDGWNIVAVSMTPDDAIYAKLSLYPTAVSPAYEYGAGYVVADPLEKGKGYWLKFNGAGAVGVSPGTFDSSVVAPVQDKWNLIGGPSGFVPASEIVPTGTTISSSFFGYGASGYYTASAIQAGHGYWVKVSGAGTLDLSSSNAAAPKQAEIPVELRSANRISVKDAAGRSQSLYLVEASALTRGPGFFELPPPPPAGGFDVRYASQRMLESWSDNDGGGIGEYPILIQGAAYPITVSWEITTPPAGPGKLRLAGGGSGTSARPIEGSGSLVFRDAASSAGLSLRLSGDASGLPAEFALGRNYPNPFNPVTHVQVDIPTESDVEVGVYDLLGRLVSTLLTGTHAAGSLTLAWDGRDAGGMSVPTGMYVVRMKAGDFTASRKVLLMK